MTARRVVVTGVCGFLGQHVSRRLAQSNDTVGVDLGPAREDAPVKTHWIARPEELGVAAAALAPDITVHAAFRNRPAPDERDEDYLRLINSVHVPLFSQLAAQRRALLLVSSSAVYGGSTGGAATIDERCPTAPVSLYGLAKHLQEQCAHFYGRRGLQVCTLRLFNLVGPGQQPGMLFADWVHQAASIPAGQSGAISVRHRATTRDFIDVRDAAEAIAAVVDADVREGVYNVASSKPASLMDLSGALQELAPGKLSFVEQSSGHLAGDVFEQRGSYCRLQQATGWSPRFGWRQSLQDLWDEVAGTGKAHMR